MVDYTRAFSACALAVGTALTTGCAVQAPTRPVVVLDNPRVAQDNPRIASEPVIAGSSACRAINARVDVLDGNAQRQGRNYFNNIGGYNYNRMYPNIMNFWGKPEMERFTASSNAGTFIIMSPVIDQKIGMVVGAAAGVYASGVRQPRDLKDAAKIAIFGALGTAAGSAIDKAFNAGELNQLDVCRSDVTKGAYDFLVAQRQNGPSQYQGRPQVHPIYGTPAPR